MEADEYRFVIHPTFDLGERDRLETLIVWKLKKAGYPVGDWLSSVLGSPMKDEAELERWKRISGIKRIDRYWDGVQYLFVVSPRPPAFPLKPETPEGVASAPAEAPEAPTWPPRRRLMVD